MFMKYTRKCYTKKKGEIIQALNAELQTITVYPPYRTQKSSLIKCPLQSKCDFGEGVSLHFSALLAVQIVPCNYVRKAGTAQQLVAYLQHSAICPQFTKPSLILQ